MTKSAKEDPAQEQESSSAFFERSRPKFLDWRPQTEEERLQDARTRREERDAQLKKVTALEAARQAGKAALRNASRTATARKK